MGNTNYFCSIVKILENPVQVKINDKISITTFRTELFQIRSNCINQIIFLVFLGKKSDKIKKYCRVNNYILVEGYLSIKEKKSNTLSSKTVKQIIVTVLKVYPI